MGHRVLPAADAFWRPSNQMGVLNTDLAKQLAVEELGARLWRVSAGGWASGTVLARVCRPAVRTNTLQNPSLSPGARTCGSSSSAPTFATALVNSSGRGRIAAWVTIRK